MLLSWLPSYGGHYLWHDGPPAATVAKSTVGARIDNSIPLENQAQEQDSNPEPETLWAAGPVDPGTARLHFFETEPPKLSIPPSPKVRIPAQARP
ncbi:hypothetical protein DSO57_1015962 [Entomophthora muscae]|uniref:Uncharacterized protein n=1 Tax=Entomophthora muscae TaxID=34485 RepID=A0ACC2T567_9FUNG|nr:hypothetical protein DSO57_1015962 [Entomophthora muscae]